jgi:competence protein ComEC
VSDEVPAAAPLIAYVCGLACTHSVRDAAGIALIAVLLLAMRRPRWAVVCAAAAVGGFIAVHQTAVRADETRALAAMSGAGFVVIEAPIDRQWMPRGDAFVLRVPRFTVSPHIRFEQPLTIYARFEPPPMAMEKRIRVEGFVRANERGEWMMTVKSPRLLEYRGAMSPFDPAAWNRALSNRLGPFAARYASEVALVEALALGRGERLGDEIRDNYKRGGTYHLLVFSGLQIAFAAGVIALFLRWLRAPRIADWSLLLFAALAPMFIGPTASVSRSSIGIGLYAVARILKRPTTLENLWCIAALLRLTIAPGDLTDAAFHLTYAGAGALLFIGKPLAGRRAPWLSYAFGAECVVVPLTLFHFHQYALGGSLTTVLLTPMIFAMLIVSSIACCFPAAMVFDVLGFLHRLCTSINDVAAFGSGWYAAPPAAAIIGGFAAGVVAIAWLRGRRRAAAIVGSMTIPIIAAMVVAHRQPPLPTMTLLDVGQGDAILLRTGDQCVLIDGGSRFANVVPLLLDRGVRHLDAVVLTHAHPDHCGGLPAVLSRLSVRKLWITPRRFRGDCAQQLLAVASAELVPIHLVRDGDMQRVGDFTLRALVGDRTFKRAPENNSSIVLRATVGGRVILLTGDVEREAEASLASRAIRADVLKVAHHGSRSSTTAVLLDAAAPRLAMISCGRHNLFGHPHTEVLEALAARRIRLWRTDLSGTIEMQIDSKHLLVRPQIDTPP